MISNELIDGGRAAAPASRWANAGLWLAGTLFGVAAYVSGSGLLAVRNPLAWGVALVVGLLSLPIQVTVHLTFPFWASFELGHGFVVALTACLYHGTVAVVLGVVYRRRRLDALAIGGALLALHLILYFFWQDLSPALYN